DPLPHLVLNGMFLALYLVAVVYLVNTAHQGGLLVHAYGVRAMIDVPSQNAASESAHEVEEEESER
ncbi:MAG: hypothetical protein WC655_27745, partial [Candidatus Hydrogenedentales bacterium]